MPPNKFDDRWYLIVAIAIPVLLVVIVVVLFQLLAHLPSNTFVLHRLP